jgi:hypothetical protein
MLIPFQYKDLRFLVIDSRGPPNGLLYQLSFSILAENLFSLPTMSSPQEFQAIQSHVARLVSPNEDVKRITWLLSNGLSLDERALFLFEPSLLSHRLQAAQEVVQVQGSPGPRTRAAIVEATSDEAVFTDIALSEGFNSNNEE